MKQLLFFASKKDILPVLAAVEQHGHLKYVRAGQSAIPHCESFARGAELPNLGVATADSATNCDSYLVSGHATPLKMRTISTNAGVNRFCIDQLVNPDTVVFTPGGMWKANIMLHGRVATVSESVPAKQMMRWFNSAFKNHFRKVKAFYVGPEAFALLEAGHRLTISAQSPREFDLTMDSQDR